MTLHIAWMKFKRVALKGKTKFEIEAIKPIFYAGMTAAMFEMKAIAGWDVGRRASNRETTLRQINARFTELEDFRRYTEQKAKGSNRG